MNNQLNVSLKGYVKTEFWIMTVCVISAYLLSFLSFVDANQHFDTRQMSQQSVPLLFSYFVVFILYLSLCFYLSPAFEREDETAAKSTPIILLFMVICYLVGVVNMYFAALISLKVLFIYFTRNTNNKRNELYYEAALLAASWIVFSLINGLYLPVPLLFKFYVFFVVLAGIIVYLYAVYSLCPSASSKKWPNLYYWWCMFILAIVSTITIYFTCLSFKTGVDNKPIGSLSIIIGSDEDAQNLTILNLLNGCAYCCTFHANELREMGITQSLIDKIPGYKHSGSFDEKQALVLRWTDAITFLSDDMEYIKKELGTHFTERELVDLTASISLMNALNRLRIALGGKF